MLEGCRTLLQERYVERCGLLHEAVGSTSLRSEDPFDEAITNSWLAARAVWFTGELNWRACSSSLGSLQSGEVFFSRAARHDSSACCEALRRGVLRVETLAVWGARFAGAEVLASGEISAPSPTGGRRSPGTD